MRWAALVAFLAVTPAQAQFNGVSFTAGAANIPNPDFSMCDFNVPTTFTNTWYIDPLGGDTQTNYTAAGISMDPAVTPHQGDAGHPWDNLQAVFTIQSGYARPLLSTASGGSGTLSPIRPGDEVLLNTASAAAYGAITTNGTNPTYVKIAAAPGQSPQILSLTIGASGRLALDGIAAQKLSSGSAIVNDTGGKNIVMTNMSSSSTDYATAATWTTQAQWIAGITATPVNTSTGFGFGSGASCTLLKNSHTFIVQNGMAMGQTNHLWVEGNEFDHFGQDALDFQGSFIVIKNNHLHDPVNQGGGAHMDFMQGFCICGKTNHDIWIDSNLIIYQEDPALPFGPGAFNGAITQTNDQWTNLFITNNLVALSSDWLHGLGIGGCNDCVMANNTVNNKLEVNKSDLTRGSIYNSSNILVTNNIVNRSSCTDANPTVNMTNNIIMKSTDNLNTVCYNGVISAPFGATGNLSLIGGNYLDTTGVNSELTNVDPTTLTYNFHLLSTAPARGFGQSALPRPLTDYLGRPTNTPVDAGALAYP